MKGSYSTKWILRLQHHPENIITTSSALRPPQDIVLMPPYTLHPARFTSHLSPYTLRLTPYTSHPTPYTLHPLFGPLNLLPPHFRLYPLLVHP